MYKGQIDFHVDVTSVTHKHLSLSIIIHFQTSPCQAVSATHLRVFLLHIMALKDCSSSWEG